MTQHSKSHETKAEAHASERKSVQGSVDIDLQHVLDVASNMTDEQKDLLASIVGPGIVRYLKSQRHIT